jgi:putative protease
MKKRIELLAPAGDFDSLKAAIASGANAVYLGGNAFSARAFAKNFDREELKEAVAYAHLRHVKIHVTCNILYQEDELAELMDYIDFLYKIQVDAVLIQDIGVLKLVHEMYPDFEIHVSTQMTLSSLEAVRYFEDLGVSRVVLAREMSLEEIKKITSSTKCEVEVFAHGALCVAYSGQCLMSSMIGKRSGNRGACAQPCRLPYTLEEDGKVLNEKPAYLMSTRDLCTIAHVGDLIEAGVTSLKIEGRMKKPEYVASIVHAYKKAIDHYYDQSLPDYSEVDLDEMKQMFNRHYTNGYAFFDGKVVDDDFPGNRGILIGKVVSYNKHNKHVVMTLTHDLTQEDSVVFKAINKGRPVNKLFVNGKLVHVAHKGETCEIEFNEYVDHGDVMKTVSIETIKSIDERISAPHKYRQLDMSLYAYEGAPLSLTGVTDHVEVTVTSEDLVEASDHPLPEGRIREQLSKLGGTIYCVGAITLYKGEEVTFKISTINALRRALIAELDEKLSQAIIHHEEKKDVPVHKVTDHKQGRYLCVCTTLAQLDEALEVIDDVYYYYDEHNGEALEIFKKHDKTPGLYLPRILKGEDVFTAESWKEDFPKVIVNDYGSYRLWQGNDLIIGTGLNVYNHLSAAAFKEPVIASYEADKKALKAMCDYNEEVILPIYGRVENMISEH